MISVWVGAASLAVSPEMVGGEDRAGVFTLYLQYLEDEVLSLVICGCRHPAAHLYWPVVGGRVG